MMPGLVNTHGHITYPAVTSLEEMGQMPVEENTLEAAYKESPFVRLTGTDLPEIKHVAHTNFCDIGWRISPDGRQLVMVACIDNLVKGAAGQAIQNFNVAYGFPEATGLN